LSASRSFSIASAFLGLHAVDLVHLRLKLALGTHADDRLVGFHPFFRAVLLCSCWAPAGRLRDPVAFAHPELPSRAALHRQLAHPMVDDGVPSRTATIRTLSLSLRLGALKG